MRTATRSLFIASLLTAACSSGNGDTNSPLPGSTDPSNTTGSPTNSSGTPVGSGSGMVTPPNGSSTGGTPSAGGSASAAPTSMPPSSGVVTPCEPGVPETTQVPRITPLQYGNAMRDLLNVTTLPSGKTPQVELGLDDNQGAMTSTEWTAYQKTASTIAKAVLAGPDKASFISCDPAADAMCFDTTIRNFGRLAFRRPLSEEEVTKFKALDNLEPKGTPTQVTEAILTAFLVHPSFILLPELATDTPDTATGGFKLSQYEVATRLATLIWRSVPDNTLLDAAEANQLSTKEQILMQAQRMIAVTEKSSALLSDFHRFYVGMFPGSHWDSVTHDANQLPQGVTQEGLSASMMSEISAFFGEVAKGGTFRDLFLSPVAYINKDNAAIYGKNPADYTDELVRTELDEMERPGFLTRAGFLASFSHNDSTSPILRGAFISLKMLGAPPLAPKAGVPTEPPPGNYMTQREWTDALTSPNDCSACHHVAINPAGYVMEAFDSVGRLQTTDPLGGAINTTADVQIDGQLVTIHNPRELMEAIANGTLGKRYYAERWVEYGMGRATNRNDACTVDVLAQKLTADGNYTIIQLLADLSQSEIFALRKSPSN